MLESGSSARRLDTWNRQTSCLAQAFAFFLEPERLMFRRNWHPQLLSSLTGMSLEPLPCVTAA